MKFFRHLKVQPCKWELKECGSFSVVFFARTLGGSVNSVQGLKDCLFRH